MSIPEVGKKIRVSVPSTTANLGPGFDCLGAALDLYNEFIFTRIEGGGDRFDLIMESTDGNHLRGGPENLVFRAAQKVWNSANIDPFALEARVKLAVPPARGLAIDIEGHPDNVVPSLLGGLCLTARSSSQRWRIIRCDWHDSIKAVVAIPAIRLSTSEARKVMPKNIPISDAVTNMGALTLLLNGLKTGNEELIKEGMFDKLHEPYRWKLIKGGLEVKDAALHAGALGCAISGAGPSILALCKKENGKNVSQAMVKAWEKSGVASRAPFLNVQTTGSQFSTISGK